MDQIFEEVSDLMIQDILESRATRSRLFKYALKICKSIWFQCAIALAILANTLALSLDRFPIEP